MWVYFAVEFECAQVLVDVLLFIDGFLGRRKTLRQVISIIQSKGEALKLEANGESFTHTACPTQFCILWKLELK